MRRIGAALVVVCLPFVVGAALGAQSAHQSSRERTLLGNTRIASKIAHERPGSAVVFPFTAGATGTASAIKVYLDKRSRSTMLLVGIYVYRNGRPAGRVARAKLSRPHAGRWNSLAIARTEIRSGHRYGISILGNGGSLYFRDRDGSACRGAQSERASEKALPASWRGGKQRTACAMSAYVVGAVRRAAKAPSRPGSPAGATANGNPGTPAAPAAGTPVVGSAGQPAVTCSITISPGASLQSALAAASPRSVVCLSAGNWAHQTLTGVTPASPGVTLAAAPNAIGQVTMAGISTTGVVNNLTVEGLKLSGGVFILDAATNDTFAHNTMEGWGGGDAQSDSAFFLFPGNSGSSASATNITMIYNQIDNVPQCLQDDTDGGNTFSHNVCGPGIGYDGSTGQHYIQAENLSNETIDNNAFEGPLASGAVNNGSHTNVLHACGANLQFNNNIVWESQALAQTVLLGDDCQTTNTQANNNLIVEASSPETYSLWIDDAHSSSNVTFSNDTVVNSVGYGGVSNQIGGSFTGHDNLAANDGNNAYDGFHNCNCSHNASDDATGDVRWSPRWQSTTWTPNAGSPWNPPPAGYYKPTGIAAAFGYQGTIGP
jgi:hypothetical protein